MYVVIIDGKLQSIWHTRIEAETALQKCFSSGLVKAINFSCVELLSKAVGEENGRTF